MPLSGGIGSFKLRNGDDDDNTLNYDSRIRVKKLDISKFLLQNMKLRIVSSHDQLCCSGPQVR